MILWSLLALLGMASTPCQHTGLEQQKNIVLHLFYPAKSVQRDIMRIHLEREGDTVLGANGKTYWGQGERTGPPCSGERTGPASSIARPSPSTGASATRPRAYNTAQSLV